MRVEIHYIKLAMAPVLWGGALVAGRVIASEIPPFTIACIRFFLAGMFMFPVLYLKEKKFPRPTGSETVLILLLSITGVVLFNFFLFSGLQTVDAGRSAVIIAFTPAVVVLLSTVFFRERLTLAMGGGVLLAFAGALVTITYGDILVLFSEPIAMGDVWMLSAVLCWALYSMIGKFAMGNLSALTVLTYSFAAGALMLLPFAVTERSLGIIPYLSAASWVSILYLSFGSAGIAYLWYYEGIKIVGPSKASIFMNLEPAAAIFFGVLLLGETISAAILVGTALVLSGVFVATRAKIEAADIKSRII